MTSDAEIRASGGKRIEGLRTSLRPTTDADTDLLEGWLSDPEIYRYWGGKPILRDEIQAKYIRARSPQVECMIVETEGAPIGFLQYWKGRGRSGGLDMFLIPAFRGRDLGPDAARAVADNLRSQGWNRITVDPALNNHGAIRAWSRAGFVAEKEIIGDDGPALLMVFKSSDA
jgi:aminoglycoside 6'-N-acetyltransferase